MKGIYELRWANVESNSIAQAPTAADALEYANERLKDDDEFHCVINDKRTFLKVYEVLKERNSLMFIKY